MLIPNAVVVITKKISNPPAPVRILGSSFKCSVVKLGGNKKKEVYSLSVVRKVATS